MLVFLKPIGGNEFPVVEFESDSDMRFSLEFVSPRTVRPRMKTGKEIQPDQPRLSFGLSGFTFWSHYIGGFVNRTPEELYRCRLLCGMLTSHSHTHGAPPKEPWLYNEDFNNAFRLADEMKYKLMPYIYVQSKYAIENGLPMVRALFVEYPQDSGYHSGSRWGSE